MKNIAQLLKIIVLAVVLSLGLSYVYAWTAPTQSPPNGNVSAPINTSASPQVKSGGLGVGGLIRGYSNAIFDGNVGIGTTGPSSVLDVESTNPDLFEINRSVSSTAGGAAWMSLRSEGTIRGYLGFNATSGGGLSSGSLGKSMIVRSENALHLVSNSDSGGAANGITLINGNVGIGNVDPAQKLEVVGNIRANDVCTTGGKCLSAAGGGTPAVLYGGSWAMKHNYNYDTDTTTNICERANIVTNNCSCPTNYTSVLSASIPKYRVTPDWSLTINTCEKLP